MRKLRVRVGHLVEAASKAVSYAAGRSRHDLDDDELAVLLAGLPDDLVPDGSAPATRDRRRIDDQ